MADAFYSKLFLDHPQLRRLFPKNMNDQHQKLIDMLTSVVVHLEKMEGIQQEINDMAKRHIEYGVQPKHYQMVGAALLWTLEKGLGSDWNEEVAAAWTACYGLLATQMMQTNS